MTLPEGEPARQRAVGRAERQLRASSETPCILDPLGSLLGHGDTTPGAAILEHVLGARRGRVTRGLGQATGLNAGRIASLLATLAPVVLGALGKLKRQSGLDAGGLGSVLGQEQQALERYSTCRATTRRK